MSAIALTLGSLRSQGRPAERSCEAATVSTHGRSWSYAIATEAAGDPDRVKRTELDAFAALAGLEKGESWSGLLVKTFNYNKPRSLA